MGVISVETPARALASHRSPFVGGARLLDRGVAATRAADRRPVLDGDGVTGTVLKHPASPRARGWRGSCSTRCGQGRRHRAGMIGLLTTRSSSCCPARSTGRWWSDIQALYASADCGPGRRWIFMQWVTLGWTSRRPAQTDFQGFGSSATSQLSAFAFRHRQTWSSDSPCTARGFTDEQSAVGVLIAWWLATPP